MVYLHILICRNIFNRQHLAVMFSGLNQFLPALYIGRKMEKEGAEVRCHSTTRSPIAVSLEKEYPLHSRYELKSLYDPESISLRASIRFLT